MGQTEPRRRGGRGPGWRAGRAAARGVPALLGALLLIPAEGRAQACTSAPTEPSSRRIESIEPTHGPVGTEIRLVDEVLPVHTQVFLAVGQVGGEAGYEVSEGVETGELGTVAGTVTVPDWAGPERAVYALILSEDYMPVAFSEPFHVTDAEGLLRRTGTVTTLEGGCLGLEGRDATFALTGAADRLMGAQGEEVTVEARIGEGACGCAVALEVTRVLEGGP